MSQYETVLYQVSNHVATITMNRPDALNSFNAQLRRDLGAALAQAEADDSVRLIILAGAGRSFGAGQDLSEGSGPGEGTRRLLENEYKPVMMAIEQSSKLVIAAVNGAAAGVSAALALNCDLMIMADDAYIYQAFINVGLIPDGGACVRMVEQLGYRKALELIVTGEKLPADKCVALGLANKVAPSANLLDEAQAWAEQIAAKAPLALAATKRALKQAQSMDLSATISLEAEIQAGITRSEDAQEAIQAFLDKRQPVFKGR